MKHPFLEELQELLIKYDAEIEADYIVGNDGTVWGIEFEIRTADEVIASFQREIISIEFLKNIDTK